LHFKSDYVIVFQNGEAKPEIVSEEFLQERYSFVVIGEKPGREKKLRP
jgi:hypothetical protein